MTELLLALVPVYGYYAVALIVFLAAVGIPLPSSVLVVTCGGLAASGDLNLMQLIATTATCYVVGDQLAFAIGAAAGPQQIEKLKKRPKLAALVQKAEKLYSKHGSFAVFLSRTVLSPIGPSMAYLSGASKMNKLQFSVLSTLGIVLWSTAFSMLGYVSTGNLPVVSDLVASIMATMFFLFLSIGFFIWLWVHWRHFEVDSI